MEDAAAAAADDDDDGAEMKMINQFNETSVKRRRHPLPLPESPTAQQRPPALPREEDCALPYSSPFPSPSLSPSFPSFPSPIHPSILPSPRSSLAASPRAVM